MLDAAQINPPMPPLGLRTCPVCGGTMEHRKSFHVTCSTKCGRRLTGQKTRKPHGPRRPIAERFWSKIDKTPGLGPTGECWEWTGSRVGTASIPTALGYGQFGMRVDGKTLHKGAHVVAYELTYGPVPEGLEICHDCDHAPCVRPDPKHCWPGTHQENMRHAQAVGRMPIARPKPPGIEWVRFTPKQRTTLFKARLIAGVPQKVAAAKLGMDAGLLSKFEQPKKWTRDFGFSRERLIRLVRLYQIELDVLDIRPEQIKSRITKDMRPEYELPPVRRRAGRPRKYRGPVEMARYLLSLSDEQEAA